jgi:hypothetical protein
MITRYLLILLAAGLGIFRAVQGAWVPAAGLFAMAAGLIVLKLAEKQPRIRPIAYVCFAGTAVTIVMILIQRPH